MNRTDKLFWGSVGLTDAMFIATFLVPSLSKSDDYMVVSLLLFLVAVMFGMVKFLFKPMSKDIGVKYEMQRILDSSYTDEEKVRMLKELKNKR